MDGRITEREESKYETNKGWTNNNAKTSKHPRELWLWHGLINNFSKTSSFKLCRSQGFNSLIETLRLQGQLKLII